MMTRSLVRFALATLLCGVLAFYCSQSLANLKPDEAEGHVGEDLPRLGAEGEGRFDIFVRHPPHVVGNEKDELEEGAEPEQEAAHGRDHDGEDPPAIAGSRITVPPTGTDVSRPSSVRTSSPPT